MVVFVQCFGVSEDFLRYAETAQSMWTVRLLARGGAGVLRLRLQVLTLP